MKGTCVNNLNTVVPFEVIGTKIALSPIGNLDIRVALLHGVLDPGFLPSATEMFPLVLQATGSGTIAAFEFGVDGGGTLAIRATGALDRTVSVFRTW